MAAARPLREVFTDLTGDEEARRAHAADPDGFLAAHGHPGLPSELVAEAVVSYADTAPPEVAQHLAPYVIEHSSVPIEAGAGAVPTETENWFELIASAPATEEIGEAPDLDGELIGEAPLDLDELADQPGGVDFGRGAAAGAGIAAVAVGDHDEYAGTAPGHDAPGPDLLAADAVRDRSYLDDAGLDDAGLDDGAVDGDDDDSDDDVDL
jgi:hypothetical protein